MLSDFEVDSTAQIKFELSLLGSENYCVTLSFAPTVATEKILLIRLVVFAAS